MKITSLELIAIGVLLQHYYKKVRSFKGRKERNSSKRNRELNRSPNGVSMKNTRQLYEDYLVNTLVYSSWSILAYRVIEYKVLR